MHVRVAVGVAVCVAVCVAECVVVCVEVRVDSLACTGRVLSRCMCLLRRALCSHRIEPGLPILSSVLLALQGVEVGWQGGGGLAAVSSRWCGGVLFSSLFSLSLTHTHTYSLTLTHTQGGNPKYEHDT